MAYEGQVDITFMESVASRRMLYLSCYSASRVTMSTLTNEQNGQPKLHFAGLNISTTSTLRAADSANGLYYLVLTQSECSTAGLAGPARLRYSSNSCIEVTVNVNFTKLDSSDSMRAGLFALPNAAPGTAGGELTLGTGTGQITPSGGSVGIVPGNLSGVSVEVTTGGIQVASMGKGNYSGVSQEILTGGIQAASLGAATITSAKFGTGAIDAVALATDASQEIADTLLGRNVAGGSSTGRTVSESLYVLRNKTLIQGSILTVYQTDDATSSWTASISTGPNAVSGVDPL